MFIRMNKIIIISSTVFILICAIIGLSCYFGGYIPNTNKNLIFDKTDAKIISHKYFEKICSYSCNCRQICGS